MAYAAHNQERDLPLGELIVRAGLLSSVQLDAALAAARASGRRLGEVLVEDELVDERELAQIVAQQEELEFVDLGKHDLDHEALDLLSESSARRSAPCASWSRPAPRSKPPSAKRSATHSRPPDSLPPHIRRAEREAGASPARSRRCKGRRS